MRSYTSFNQDLSSGKTSCLEEVKSFLEAIKSNQDLNAFLEVFEDEALQKARTLDEQLANNQAPGRLTGMVIGIKDNLCFQDHCSEAGSRILSQFNSLYTATAIQRLMDEGAIIVGRLNCDEFGMGSSNENTPNGPVKNAMDKNRVPGGSSGGSAVAVQAGLCHASLGTDTGGSVRQPASFCGIYGLKPSYGRISRYGLIAYASSFDQIAPFTLNLDEAALLLEIMAGTDKRDATSAPTEVPSYSKHLNEDHKPDSIALLEDTLSMEGLNPQISSRVKEVADSLSNQGVNINSQNFTLWDSVVPTYQILSNAEASSNLSRYAGMLYGHQSQEAEDIESAVTLSRSEGFGEEVQRRIMLGTFVLNAGYYEAYYEKAQRIRRLIRNELTALLEDNEVIMLPTTPTGAFQFGKNAEDPVAMYLEDIFTVPASLAGLPAISIPCGHDQNGMPFGIQLIGAPFKEEVLLKNAQFIESAFL